MPKGKYGGYGGMKEPKPASMNPHGGTYGGYGGLFPALLSVKPSLHSKPDPMYTQGITVGSASAGMKGSNMDYSTGRSHNPGKKY